MIYDLSFFKVSDTDESVFDLSEIFDVELKKDNKQSFNTRWDETIITMKKQPEFLTVSFNSQSSLSHCCLCASKILFKRVNRETAPDFKRWRSDNWNRTTVRNMSPLVKDNLKGPPLALLGRNQGEEERISGDRVQCSRRQAQKEMKGFATVQRATTEFVGQVLPEVIVRKEMLVIIGIHLSVSSKRKLQTRE